jgi:hypothetical protein
MALTGATVLNGVTELISGMDDNMHTVNRGLQTQIDNLTITCNTLVESLHQLSTNQRRSNNETHDRSMNIVVSGISENRDGSVWCDEAA